MAAYTQTYTFTNGTTADGGQVNTEIVALGSSVNSITNAQVDSAAAIAISKTTLGTYTAPTTFAGTTYKSNGSTDTGGTVVLARYWQIGKQVTIVFSKTGMTMDAAATLWLLLPVVAADDTDVLVGTYLATVNGGGRIGYASILSGTNTKLRLFNNATADNWASDAGGAAVFLTLTYETD